MAAGWDGGVGFINEGGDLLEHMGQGLVLGTPVKEVVPVVGPVNLSFRMDNT